MTGSPGLAAPSRARPEGRPVPGYRTRFAPSPTGPLHLGHAYSALVAWDRAQAASGTFLLRIEDIDQGRARPKWEAAIYDDLRWLGIDWPKPVMRQSKRFGAYSAALRRLWNKGLLYPCTCTRRDIADAASAPQEGAPRHGPDGVIYPGTCRSGDRSGPLPDVTALRLDMKKACECVAFDTFFEETGSVHGPARVPCNASSMIHNIGDVVVARRDMGTSYHLSVVVDDAAQGITEIVRGEDLFGATVIHVLLQVLLDLPTPTYCHHALIRDDSGARLAKRNDSEALSHYRAQGASPQDIRTMVGL